MGQCTSETGCVIPKGCGWWQIQWRPYIASEIIWESIPSLIERKLMVHSELFWQGNSVNLCFAMFLLELSQLPEVSFSIASSSLNMVLLIICSHPKGTPRAIMWSLVLASCLNTHWGIDCHGENFTHEKGAPVESPRSFQSSLHVFKILNCDTYFCCNKHKSAT